MGIMRRIHRKCDFAKYFDLPGSLAGRLSPDSFSYARLWNLIFCKRFFVCSVLNRSVRDGIYSVLCNVFF